MAKTKGPVTLAQIPGYGRYVWWDGIGIVDLIGSRQRRGVMISGNAQTLDKAYRVVGNHIKGNAGVIVPTLPDGEYPTDKPNAFAMGNVTEFRVATKAE